MSYRVASITLQSIMRTDRRRLRRIISQSRANSIEYWDQFNLLIFSINQNRCEDKVGQFVTCPYRLSLL